MNPVIVPYVAAYVWPALSWKMAAAVASYSIRNCSKRRCPVMIENENFDFLRFYESLNDQLVLAKNRYKWCEDFEDDYGASSEAGFHAGIMKALELYRKYCPAGLLPDQEVSGNE